MILAVDVGNTNVVIGCVDSSENVIFMERVSTNITSTALEYAATIKMALDVNNVSVKSIEGSVISSVVPTVTETFREAIVKLTGRKVITVNPGIKTGLSILIDDPGQLGSDLVVAAVAGIEEYPLPQIIIDMGTATTISVINSKKQYIGGAIMTGINVSVQALTSSASLLSNVSLGVPDKVIGTNTVDCIRSGMVYYNACAIDGMIDRIEEELGEKCTVIATGGLSHKIIPLCRHEINLDDTLLLKGLIIIYKKNTGTKK